jgi:hypothetical protein
MMRPSTIDRMDPKIREEINRLRIDKGFTIDEILAHIRTMGVTVSRSAMGRHVKRLEDEVGEKIRELRIAAAAISKTVDEAADNDKAGALNRELAHSILMRLQIAKDDEGNDIPFSPQEAMFIAKALDHLSHAEKLDADRVLKIRQEAAKETAKKAATEVEKVLQTDAPGLSKDTVAKIKHQVLGVAS